ncbi:tripeptidyl-peptidase 1 precursor [Xylariaceae sp. FL0804]|nr:tripeptidyl-peptidase 1 precursor [Xylariaceae sp. FL0804]
MVGFSVIFSAVVAAQAALATPLVRPRTPYQLKERHPVPRNWKRGERAPADHVLDLQIGVKQGNFAELERHLYEVSDPDHARYGQHLSADAVKELVTPSDQSLGLVEEWLRDNGVAVKAYNSAKDWITVSMPIGDVERLLDTEYHVYEHADGGSVARAPSWSLPAHLHKHIDTIQPTNSFFRARQQKFHHISQPLNYASSSVSNSTLNKVCNKESVTPECFETLYQTKGYKTKASDKNAVAFNNFLGEHPIRSDGLLFLEKYRPEAVDTAKYFPQITLDGGPGDENLTASDLLSETSVEANLDFQAIAGVSWKTPVVSYSTGTEPPFIPSADETSNTNEPYLVWVNWLLGQVSIPQIISTSYADDEQTVPKSYATRVCQQFAQVGARGTTLFFASGDSGVGPEPSLCVTNDGLNKTTFLPEFPPSCPYVTAVGALMNFDPEVAVYADFGGSSAYTSGGGFSSYFPAPAFQKDVVSSYVASLGSQFSGMYNKAGRGYPDISAQGLNFAFFWNGSEGTVSGTSASTPLSSGVYSLVNDALLAAGKPSLGWLNPWLYKTGYKALNDITSGSAAGCGTSGFPAKKGWDAVTGWGSPNFPKLLKVLGV